MIDENIFQILVYASMGEKLQSWHESREEAETELADIEKMFPNDEFRIEEGTDYIYTKCKGCETVHAYERSDAYGISTGHWCDKCYDDPSKYTYRKDNYFDPAYAGERMDDDY